MAKPSPQSPEAPSRRPPFRAPAGATAVVVLALAGSCSPSPSSAPVDLPSDPYVRVLGTVQDGGLPHAACDCTRCEAARSDPARRRNVASLAICLPTSSAVYLIDATPDLREQIYDPCGTRREASGRVDRAPVDGVFLTHAHLGHYLGLAFFGFEAVHTRGLRVFGTPRMTAFLANNPPWDQLVRLENVRLVSIEPGAPVALEEGVTITPWLVPHRDEYTDTVAFIIEGPRRSLLYVPDTDAWAGWSPSLLQRLENVDFALLDGTFYSPAELPGRDIGSIGHPTMVTSMELLESRVAAGEVEVWFTHLNHSNPALDPAGEAASSLARRGFAVAAEGLVLPL